MKRGYSHTRKCECGADLVYAPPQQKFCKKCSEARRKDAQKKASANYYNKHFRLKKTLIKGICDCGREFEYVYKCGTKRVKCDVCRAKVVEYKNRKMSYIAMLKAENETLVEFIKTELAMLKNEIEILKRR